MKIAIASDHAGFDLKTEINNHLRNQNHNVIDLGCDNSQISVDYPDFANKAAREIINNNVDFAILICGSGIGISIAANRFKEIRAALCCDKASAQLAREHNDANILCLGSRIINTKNALEIIDIFLTSKFAGGRHLKRIAKLSQ